VENSCYFVNCVKSTITPCDDETYHKDFFGFAGLSTTSVGAPQDRGHVLPEEPPSEVKDQWRHLSKVLHGHYAYYGVYGNSRRIITRPFVKTAFQLV
jgi:hypothetical protein